MINDPLRGVLQQIKALADAALQRKPASRRQPAVPSSAKPPKSRGANTLTDHISRLREAGFFKQARTAKEVHAKLQAQYFCELNRVMMALLRLQRRKRLRKATKVEGKKKQTAYVW
ncbi:MAG TPA: hypothetical protein VMI74_02975 [Burkholderiales bacterium]|nr:hypothetical protein [Burkholderiales bacterium]